MTVVHTPPPVHTCKPGWNTRISTGEGLHALPPGVRIFDPPTPWKFPRGTVVECDCGKTYVSQGAIYVDAPGMCYFRREGWFERRRRERRQARD